MIGWKVCRRPAERKTLGCVEALLPRLTSVAHARLGISGRPLTYIGMHEQDNSVTIVPAPSTEAGATAAFPFDRLTVERFRQNFPRARWRDDLKAWFVPGKRAAQRLDRWLDRELPAVLHYADERGRDAFDFDPIQSPLSQD